MLAGYNGLIKRPCQNHTELGETAHHALAPLLGQPFGKVRATKSPPLS
jgi:hypothetical protein